MDETYTITATAIGNALSEDVMHPSSFVVDYYVETPGGSRTRFQRTSSLMHVMMARSETAIYGYLRKLHPGCNIMIVSLDFR